MMENADTMSSDEMREMSGSSGWFVFLAIVLLILGMAAIFLPIVATLSVTILFGSLILMGGIVQGVGSFMAHTRSRGWGSVVGSLLLAALMVFVGGWMLMFPLKGVLTLSLLLTIFFAVEGVFKIIAAFQERHLPGWQWIMFGGFLSLLLAWLLWIGWPGTAVWAIGLLIGIDLMVSGWALLIRGATLRKMQRRMA